MSNNQESTLGAAYNAAKGTAQSTYASVTGNTGEQVKGETNKDMAAQQNQTSHSAVKAGPVTATPSGTAVDNQDRQEGSWKQTAGSLKQGLGGLVGSTGMQQSGEQQRQEGEQQQAKGQLSDYTSGIVDRAGGAVAGAYSAVVGDTAGQADAQQHHDRGKALQRGVEVEAQDAAARK